jgi:hypothetical protein
MDQTPPEPRPIGHKSSRTSPRCRRLLDGRPVELGSEYRNMVSLFLHADLCIGPWTNGYRSPRRNRSGYTYWSCWCGQGRDWCWCFGHAQGLAVHCCFGSGWCCRWYGCCVALINARHAACLISPSRASTTTRTHTPSQILTHVVRTSTTRALCHQATYHRMATLV